MPPVSSTRDTTVGAQRRSDRQTKPRRCLTTVSATSSVSKTTEITPSGSLQLPTSSDICGSPTDRLTA
jgi:hypothetical protein